MCGLLPPGTGGPLTGAATARRQPGTNGPRSERWGDRRSPDHTGDQRSQHHPSGDEPSPLRSSTNTFWAADYFDRYIRNDDHRQRVIRYIENNPVKAKLVRAPADWAWSSARWRTQTSVLEAPKLTHPGADRVEPERRSAQRRLVAVSPVDIGDQRSPLRRSGDGSSPASE